MKKLLLMLTFAGLATVAMAQNLANPQGFKGQIANPEELKAMAPAGYKSLAGRAPEDSLNGWLNYAEAFKEVFNFGNNLGFAVNFVDYDSTGAIVYGDGQKFSNGVHAFGASFDMKDSIWEVVGGIPVSKWVPVNIDSLGFVRFYIRNADSMNVGGNMVEIIDTLFIQHFDATGMDYNAFGGTSNPANFYGVPKRSTVNMPSTLYNTSALRTDTILLGKSDSTTYTISGGNGSFRGKFTQIPVGITTRATATGSATLNNYGWMAYFRPMKKPKLGDTLIAINGATVYEKYNFFGIRVGDADNVQGVNKTINTINNSVFVYKWLRYGQTFNGWSKYICGNAFFTTPVIDYYIKVRAYKLSTESVKNSLTELSVYPNPAAANSKVDVVFNNASTSAVNITVMDINGRVVKSLGNNVCSTGKNVVSVETAGFAKGMYMVVLESATGKSTAKFAIQ